MHVGATALRLHVAGHISHAVVLQHCIFGKQIAGGTLLGMLPQHIPLQVAEHSVTPHFIFWGSYMLGRLATHAHKQGALTHPGADRCAADLQGEHDHSMLTLSMCGSADCCLCACLQAMMLRVRQS